MRNSTSPSPTCTRFALWDSSELLRYPPGSGLTGRMILAPIISANHDFSGAIMDYVASLVGVPLVSSYVPRKFFLEIITQCRGTAPEKSFKMNWLIMLHSALSFQTLLLIFWSFLMIFTFLWIWLGWLWKLILCLNFTSIRKRSFLRPKPQMLIHIDGSVIRTAKLFIYSFSDDDGEHRRNDVLRTD